MTNIETIERYARSGFRGLDEIPNGILVGFDEAIAIGVKNVDRLKWNFVSDVKFIEFSSIKINAAELAWCIAEGDLFSAAYLNDLPVEFIFFLYILAAGTSDESIEYIDVAAAGIAVTLAARSEDEKCLENVRAAINAAKDCLGELELRSGSRRAIFYFHLLVGFISIMVGGGFDWNNWKNFDGKAELSRDVIFFRERFKSVIGHEEKVESELDFWIELIFGLQYESENDIYEFSSLLGI